MWRVFPMQRWFSLSPASALSEVPVGLHVMLQEQFQQRRWLWVGDGLPSGTSPQPHCCSEWPGLGGSRIWEGSLGHYLCFIHFDLPQPSLCPGSLPRSCVWFQTGRHDCVTSWTSPWWIPLAGEMGICRAVPCTRLLEVSRATSLALWLWWYLLLSLSHIVACLSGPYLVAHILYTLRLAVCVSVSDLQYVAAGNFKSMGSSTHLKGYFPSQRQKPRGIFVSLCCRHFGVNKTPEVFAVCLRSHNPDAFSLLSDIQIYFGTSRRPEEAWMFQLKLWFFLTEVENQGKEPRWACNIGVWEVFWASSPADLKSCCAL